jgi:hypothetical protein
MGNGVHGIKVVEPLTKLLHAFNRFFTQLLSDEALAYLDTSPFFPQDVE